MIQHFVNKWLMRLKEARTVLVVALWSIMALVQVLGFLRPYLNAIELVAVAVFMGLSGLTFTYLYDKLELMKGEQRQRIKRKDNFVGESMVLNHLGMIHFFSTVFDKSEEEMLDGYGEFLDKYHDGVSLKELKQ